MEAFEEIIGYEDVKHELRRIADALNHSEAYRALGAKAPSGLLLHGSPGVGKTLMANCLIKASGRKAFVCRKTKPSEEFIGIIKETFDAAIETRLPSCTLTTWTSSPTTMNGTATPRNS